MTTYYPLSLDTFTNPTSTDTLATAGGSTAIPHANQHTNLNDAVSAIQVKLGTSTSRGSFPANITIPVTPTANTDAASKQYVDAATTGMNIHESCEAATTGALTATYADGITLDVTGGYGPGATLTNSGSLAALVLDGYTLAQYDRVLVKNQADAKQNGIYSLTIVGSGSVAWVLTRATDYDNGNTVEVNAGDLIYVIHGTQSGSYVQTNEGSYSGVPQGGIIIKAGTGDNITFTQISGVNATATTATNLAGTTQYSIPFQSNSATTGYISIGTANQLLSVNSGANGYTWTSPSSLTVGSATNATNATNVANTTTTSSSTFYIAFGSSNTTTNQGTNTNASLTYVPSTGTLSATIISGTSLGGSLLSSATPLMNGTASVGTNLIPSRDNHVHPTDTTRAPLASPTFTGAIDASSTVTSFFATPTSITLGAAATTATLFGAGTTISLGASTGTLTLANPTITLSNATALNINGASPTIATSQTTGTINIFNTGFTGAINLGGASTGAVTIGGTSATSTVAIASTLKPRTGTATSGQVPIIFTSGVNLTTQAGGSVEYDGTNLYVTPSSSATNTTNGGRGFVDSSMFTIIGAAANSLNATATTAQNIFPTGQGTLGVAGTTTYLVDALIMFTNGATSHNTTFSFAGTATWTSSALDLTWTTTAANTAGTTFNSSYATATTAAPTFTILSATTTTAGIIKVKGILRINAAGTIIPSITFSAATGATPTILSGSYMRLTPAGSNTATAIGAWA